MSAPLSVADLRAVRSALFVPASNPRAIARARTVGADLVILDLEDAVRDEDKGAARVEAIRAAGQPFGDALIAIRVNGTGRAEHDVDCRAVKGSGADIAVLPMAARAADVAEFAARVAKPVLVMIETAAAILGAAELARVPGVVGLIAGTNDICAETGIRNQDGRSGLTLALQTIVLAARSARLAVFDGVYNAIDDAAGFDAEATQGRAWGFDGKALIHPDQVEPANRIFSPDAAEIEDAQALVAAAAGGAQRFRGRMVEALHVEAAARMLARAGVIRAARS